MRQIGARLVIAVQGGDLVVAGARQHVLRLDYFDAVGDTGLKAVARLVDFLAGEIDAEPGDIHFAARAGQLGDARFARRARCGCESPAPAASTGGSASSGLVRSACMRPPVKSGTSTLA